MKRLLAALSVLLALAFAYFLSAMVRAITATLSPTLIPEFDLQARDLGLLAGGYFLGFAATQLPLGHWLDRHGPNIIFAKDSDPQVIIDFIEANFDLGRKTGGYEL